MTRKSSVTEYKFADVAIDARDFRVRRAGEMQRITPLAFKVLLYLIEHRGRAVEKQEIFEQIWGDQFVSDNALTRVVREIRQVLGDAAAAPRFIETVPKRGYRFIAEVEETLIQPEPEVEERDRKSSLKSADHTPSTGAPRRGGHYVFTAGLLAGSLVLLAGWLLVKNYGAVTAAVVTRTAQITNWSGLETYPTISPEGNLLAYSSDQTGSFEIYVKPLASNAKELQITTDGNQNFQPAFSPDGQRIAYHSKTRGGIWIIPVSGGAAQQLTDFGTNPSFSPDGRHIAFQSGGLTDLSAGSRTLPPSVLWLVAADGGQPQQLTQAGSPIGGHSSPLFSPDGKHIVFNAEDLASYGFWSIRIADGKLQKISLNGFDPVYAPDRKSIFYATFSGLWQLPIVPGTDEPAGEPVRLVDGGPAQIRRLRISADGKKLVYGMLTSKSNLASAALAAQGDAVGQPALFMQNAAFRNTFPSFSPDGTRIIYVLWQTGGRGVLRMAEASGQNQVELTQKAVVPHWFSDGTRVGFIADRDEPTPKFWSIDLATRKETLLYAFNSDVDFAKISPDEKRIAFNSKENGTINIWLADLETGAQKQLTFDAEFAGFPVWSPDGKTLAAQIKRGDDTHIVLISADDGEMRQLTDESGQSWVHSFSPDGDKIVFAGQRAEVWNVYAVSRTTGEVRKLTSYDKLNAYVRYPAWSPANDKIVFEYAETTGNVWLTELK